jgi:ubiquitin-protein ligase
MEELRAAGVLDFTAHGDPPDLYEVTFATGDDGQAQDRHRVDLYCHLEYPRRPPIVTWRTPIFHPNVMPPERGGAVCLGTWSPSQSLADVSRRLMRMASYELVNAADALNPEAARQFLAAGQADGIHLRR